jgi:hypothetical protein
MSEELILSVPISLDGFPNPDFQYWTYSGDPAILYAMAYVLGDALKNGGGIQFVDTDRVEIHMSDGKWQISAPELFGKPALYALSQMIREMANTLVQGIFSVIHGERVRQELAKRPRIAVPGAQGIQ